LPSIPAPPGETPESDQELAFQSAELVGIDTPVCVDDKIQGRIELVQVLSEYFPEYTFDPVPPDRITDLPRYGDAEPWTTLIVRKSEHGERHGPGPAPIFINRLVLTAARESKPARERTTLRGVSVPSADAWQ
jgi:hypothetical protein